MESADKSRELLQRAAALVRAALPSRASVQETPVSRPGSRSELLLEITWEAAGEISAARVLQLFGGDPPARAPSRPGRVWVAPKDFPVRARAELRERDVSFVHPASGTVHIVTPGMVIDRTLSVAVDRRLGAPRTMSDPFGDGASRIVRTLLRTALGPSPRPWGVRELAIETGVDRTTTSEVLRWLEQSELVNRERLRGRRGRAISVQINEPIRVLERWSATYDWTANARLPVHAPFGSPERFMARLKSHLENVRWVVTLQAAAAALAPHAAWDRIHVYVDAPNEAALHAIAEKQGWSTGGDGKLVLMCPFYRKSVWDNVRTVQRTPVVDIVQLLLDLWRYPVRGREQAEHLIEIRRRLPPILFERRL